MNKKTKCLPSGSNKPIDTFLRSLKMPIAVLLLVGFCAGTALANTDGMKDTGAKCGGAGSVVGTVFPSTMLGGQIGCKVQTLNVINGSGGNLKSGGNCGRVEWPQHLSGNGCGPDKKGGTIDE